MATAKKDEVEVKQNVLIISATNNIKSNHYYDDLIAKEIGVQVDSLDFYFNGEVKRNLIANEPSKMHFVTTISNEDLALLNQQLEIIGEGESSEASIDHISLTSYQTMLNKANTNYLLVINQHYLKKIDETMNTVYHIISYTLFDKDKQKVNSATQYYATMKLENVKVMVPLIKKTTSKIALKLNKSMP